MNNKYVIPEDDPDLEAFELLIADFHPQLSSFKKGDRPSYKYKKFYNYAFQASWLPGNDDDYCLFAFSFFNEAHLHNYLLSCHEFLETPYGRKREKGIEKITESFEELAKDTSSALIRELKLLVEKSCAIWADVVREYMLYEKPYIDEELQQTIINHCHDVSTDLMTLSKSEELEFGELKTLNVHGRYGILAKVLLQEYIKLLPKRVKAFALLWVVEINQKVAKQKNTELKKLTIPPDFEAKLPKYIDVVLAHHLVKQLSMREGMPSSPCDFIYKEINTNKFAKSRDLRAQYRWLFIKAWLYSCLSQHSMTLSEAAEAVSNDDDFFYMRDMPKIEDFQNESHKKEIQQARFLDLKNNLSAWANDKSENGYIYSQILGASKDQA